MKLSPVVMQMRRESRIRMSILWHWASDIRLRVFTDLNIHAIVSLRSVLRDQGLSHLPLDLQRMGVLSVRGCFEAGWIMRINLGEVMNVMRVFLRSLI